jgi:hypothetical protein
LQALADMLRRALADMLRRALADGVHLGRTRNCRPSVRLSEPCKWLAPGLPVLAAGCVCVSSCDMGKKKAIGQSLFMRTVK